MRRLASLTAVLVALACTPPPERADDPKPGPAAASPAGGSSPTTDSPAARPEPPPLPPLPTTAISPAADGFELRSPGIDPRARLRLHPSPSTRERVAVTLRLTMGLSGTALPPMRQVLPPIELTTTADVIARNGGRIEVTLVHDELRVDEAGGASLRAAMEQIGAFEQRLAFDERGQISESRLRIPEGAAEQLARTLGTLGETIEQSLVRLPEQDVGVGATWAVSSPLQQRGLELEQTVETQLVARDGDRVELLTAISQRPLADKFVAPDQPTELDIVEFDSRGASRIHQDLGKLLPDAMHTKIETRFTAQTGGDNPQQLSFEMIVELELVRRGGE